MRQRGGEHADDRRVRPANRAPRRAGRANAAPERPHAEQQKHARQKHRHERDSGRDRPATRLSHGSEVCRKREQRARHGLRRSVAREKLIGRDCARDDGFCLQQGQHHVAAAEYERARARERVCRAQQRGGYRGREKGQQYEQRDKRAEADDRRTS